MARSLAEYSIQLWSLEFTTIGSLYLDGWEARKDYAFGTEGQTRASDSSPHTGKMSAGFVVGPIVAPFYFKERHLHTPSNRGPYLTSQEYMREKTDLESSYKSDEIELFKSTRVEEVLDELEEDFLEDCDSILDLCKGYLEALPTIFPAQDSLAEGPFVPCHEDLNQGNILVDPENFAITGIIDWEMISIVPLWQARSFPKLFNGIDPADSVMFGESDKGRVLEEPPRPENYDIEDDDSIHSDIRSYAISKRDVWDNWLLRKAFSEALAQQGVHVEASVSEKRQRTFDEGVSLLNYRWKYAKVLLEKDLKVDDA